MEVAQPTRAAADPRPSVIDGPSGPVVVGSQCLACGHAHASVVPRCPRCAGETEEARFGPAGTVWSVTTIHVPSGEREAPYTLAYVDLDDGPRVLAHVTAGAATSRVGGRVGLVGQNSHGDPEVTEVDG